MSSSAGPSPSAYPLSTSSSPLAAAGPEALRALPPPPTTLGVFLIGAFFGVLLYGLSAHQTYRYARVFPSDSRFIKMLVVAVMLLETIHVVLTLHISYHYLVLNYFNPEALLHGVWSLNILPALSAVIVLVSQLFSARRVALIGSRQRIVVIAAVVLLSAEVALAIVGTAIAFLFDRRTIVAGITVIALGVATAGDALLSGTMLHAIKRSRASMTAANESPVDRLQLYLLNTGVITTFFNLLSFIFAAASPSTLTYVTITVVTARLYSNCMLGVLNSRQHKIAGMEIFADGSVPGIITDAELDSAKEIWNVPKLQSETEPDFIRVEISRKV